MEKKKQSRSQTKTLEETDKNSSVVTSGVSTSETLAENIKIAVEGLFYVSETDAKITPYAGAKATDVTAEELLKQIGKSPDSAIEQRDFTDFFANLTEIQDWFGDEEKENARKFAYLKEVLENNLRDLKVFKIGKIQLEIYVVGLDENDKLLGINTKAVET